MKYIISKFEKLADGWTVPGPVFARIQDNENTIDYIKTWLSRTGHKPSGFGGGPISSYAWVLELIQYYENKLSLSENKIGRLSLENSIKLEYIKGLRDGLFIKPLISPDALWSEEKQ